MRSLIDHISEDRQIKVDLSTELPLLYFAVSNAAILESWPLWPSRSTLSFQSELAMRRHFVGQAMKLRC